MDTDTSSSTSPYDQDGPEGWPDYIGSDQRVLHNQRVSTEEHQTNLGIDCERELERKGASLSKKLFFILLKAKLLRGVHKYEWLLSSNVIDSPLKLSRKDVSVSRARARPATSRAYIEFVLSRECGVLAGVPDEMLPLARECRTVQSLRAALKKNGLSRCNNWALSALCTVGAAEPIVLTPTERDTVTQRLISLTRRRNHHLGATRVGLYTYLVRFALEETLAPTDPRLALLQPTKHMPATEGKARDVWARYAGPE
jgi:hypothetical protein